jgi:hypothetical protein
MPSIQENIEQLQKTEVELKTKQEELEKTKVTNADFEKQNAALAQEKERVLADLKVAREEKEKAKVKEESFSEKIISENTQKAEQKVMLELGLKTEDFQPIKEAYSKIPNKPVSEDLIREELLSVYASKNAKTLIEAQRKLKQQEVAAGNYSQQQSNSGGAGAGFGNAAEEVQLDQSDYDAIKRAGVTVDVYKRWRKEGKI